ncbi:MAG: Peptide chain release factor 2 [Parcubacteria group bacterium GW2011_GWA1_42_7]|nr:MAG: Peptide chain release factor 2 [Parcubacteria group bacterium GW2011_GWB1_42_6]KKS69933.1 MAG: Peptide chain release factor 2 [Parcubacteria group bacterium GW2011_GWA1_42_7]
MAGKAKIIADIEQRMADSSFWQNQEAAKEASQKLAELKNEREEWENMDLILSVLDDDVKKLPENPSAEEMRAVEKELKEAEKKTREQEIKVFFSGPYDRNNVLLSIYSGAGGTEAQDWANMLLRMYTRYAERKGFKTNLLDIHEGQEAGIKSATLEIRGPFAYGFLKNESGVHRLVRLSPFNANNLRHTSFSLVEILPEIEKIGEIQIKPEDLRVDTYRSSGPGGQNVNKLETAVRVTHLPTNIVVSCQIERSQSANREKAMKMLYSKLYQLETKKKQQEITGLKAGIQSGEGTAEWGSQIRNYVLHPYKLVKDVRTGVESVQPDQVLDGDLEEFIEAEVRKV